MINHNLYPKTICLKTDYLKLGFTGSYQPPLNRMFVCPMAQKVEAHAI
jgi:hypothetical protein